MRQLKVTHRFHALFAAVLAAIASLSLANSARAQGTMGAVPDPISARDLERYAARLDLSRHQRAAVESMHDVYREEFGQLRNGEIERFMNSTRNMGGGLAMLMDRAATRKAFKDLDDVLNKIRNVDNRFFDQVQTVLTEEQMAKITVVRQMRERVRYRSGLSRLTAFINPGVSVDLSELASDLTLSPQERQAFDPALMQYESSLTTSSRKLYEATSTLVLEALDAVQTPDLNEDAVRDPERRGQMFQNFRTVLSDIQLRLANKASELNDLNRRSLRTLTAALEPENARSLREQFIRRAYPEVRTGAAVMRAFTTVQKFKELTPEQQQTVTVMASDYDAAWARLTEQAMDLIDGNRKTQTFFDMDRDTRRAQADQLSALREKRTQLNETTLANLRALLTPEQSERLDKTLAQNSEGDDNITATALVAPGGGGAIAVARVSTSVADDDASASDPFLPKGMSRSELDRYAARLNLAADQRGLLSSLHADYQEAYRELEDGPMKEVRQAQQSLWSMNPGGGPLTAPTPAAIDSLHVLRKRAVVSILDLDKKFFEDLQILLGDTVDAAKIQRLHNSRLREIYSRAAEQSNVFAIGGPAGRREFRGGGPGGRAMRMMGGDTGEAGVDLASVVDSMQLVPTDSQAFDAALLEYEHSALNAFQKMFDAALNMQVARDKMVAQMAQDNREGERGQRMGDGFRTMMEGDGRIANESRRTVTSLNRSTLARLTELLPAHGASELRRAYNQKAFPDVFQDPRSAQPQLEAALNLGDLSEQQRAQIQEIAVGFRTEYEQLSDKLVELESNNPAAGPPQNRDWQVFAERMRIREKVEFDRNDLNDRTLAKLRTTLNEQQIQQLGGLQPLAAGE